MDFYYLYYTAKHVILSEFIILKLQIKHKLSSHINGLSYLFLTSYLSSSCTTFTHYFFSLPHPPSPPLTSSYFPSPPLPSLPLISSPLTPPFLPSLLLPPSPSSVHSEREKNKYFSIRSRFTTFCFYL